MGSISWEPPKIYKLFHITYIRSLGQKKTMLIFVECKVFIVKFYYYITILEFTVLLHSFTKRVIIMLYVKQLHITVKTALV